MRRTRQRHYLLKYVMERVMNEAYVYIVRVYVVVPQSDLL